ncbi:membrane hypothetical protein [Hyphomicrobiales bacterium]|nr:membrane hypothetical protein [Hyphomicrobiales bacterium]CAH1681036.1 membrane hypothetical protein [Hyphomicrobiales bacterium]
MTRTLFMAAGKSKPPVVVAGGVDRYIIRSEDGVNWTSPFNDSGGTSYFNQIIFANGLFVAVSSHGIYTSPNGSTWTLRLGGAGEFSCVAFGGGLFVAMGAAFYTSPDGITWTSRSMSTYLGPTITYVSAVAYGNSTWVCVGVAGTTSRPFTKTGTPAAVWTSQATLTGSDRYVGLRYTAGAFYMMRQAAAGALYRSVNDGVSFSNAGIQAATNCGVDWAYNGSLWVAVGSNGTAPQLKTSTDISVGWSTVNTSFFTSTTIAAVEYIPGLDLWVIGGTGGLMAYSPDVINWTLGTVTGLGTRAIQAITYGYI